MGEADLGRRMRNWALDVEFEVSTRQLFLWRLSGQAARRLAPIWVSSGPSCVRGRAWAGGRCRLGQEDSRSPSTAPFQKQSFSMSQEVKWAGKPGPKLVLLQLSSVN